MKDTYYIVQQQSHPKARKIPKYHGLSFVLISEGVLEHVEGDRDITQMLEIVNEELKVKKNTSPDCSIFSISKTEFESYVAGYQERLRKEVKA